MTTFLILIQNHHSLSLNIFFIVSLMQHKKRPWTTTEETHSVPCMWLKFILRLSTQDHWLRKTKHTKQNKTKQKPPFSQAQGKGKKKIKKNKLDIIRQFPSPRREHQFFSSSLVWQELLSQHRFLWKIEPSLNYLFIKVQVPQGHGSLTSASGASTTASPPLLFKLFTDCLHPNSPPFSTFLLSKTTFSPMKVSCFILLS